MSRLLLAVFIGIFSLVSEASGVESFRLSNGMQVVLIPNHRAPAITQMVWYKVGAVDEPAGKSGLAHLFEHLMFKETKNLKIGEFSKLIANVGGTENAFTTADYTAYFQAVTKDSLDLVMKLEAERMVNLIINKDILEKEKKIVLEERNMRIENDPSSLLTEEMLSSLFGEHPYGTPVIGWKEEIESYSVKDVKDFYRKHYFPNNAVLVISGDTTKEEVINIAEKHYGTVSYNTKKIKRRSFPELPPPSKQLITMEDERIKQPEWMRYYLAPSILSGKTKFAFPLIVLSQILGGGETSRLYKSLVLDKGIAVDAGSFYSELHLGKTTFGIYAIPKNGFDGIPDAIEKEIELLLKNGLSDKELRRAKNILKATSIYARDSITGMAFSYGQPLAIGLNAEYVSEWSNKIEDVTEKNILEAAEYVLKSDMFVTGMLKGTSYKIRD